MRLFISFILTCIATVVIAQRLPESNTSIEAIRNTTPTLSEELEAKSLALGNAIFIRIFKEEKVLEVWIEKDESFTLFKTYEICSFSGKLGPKQKQGDMQSPEGFYFVPPSRMNPWSSYHLSFNLGYPNSYDRSHGYTGNYLMVHGRCVSIGCYAMTDEYIDEIYTLAHKALENGQQYFRVHAFPFRMTEDNMQQHHDSQWLSFWQNLKQGYDWFEEYRTPPNAEVRDGVYVFN
ncbi:L,D-transpeptidase family protein [Roseivirga pacifica]|uniref:L,D-transpeptidase family protein n=1 Tax=Roseivirga pacifica TaxID=1267423 RepID=UPI0020957BA7|nr:murein L,D-transpeptidase family protein [Roseivirga pacifica]MCO6359280.1 2-dehydro-3-deoxyphosphooctonate aldolase [Roseivirga pacifica]MCO6366649.1 2-dehydro-3-deoxyphosphooctonate aldolase [Roseivirga pacifica]MCO6370818.1 2-dehydro-3-deoxyphosphooctonate aldolase [Roseivirga pacifica]MCO6374303.1 2-dehydro-3-deoxyphosphooctonate aldolase [Roseivirga pacifica]MCO6379564.1 2-dehydro-3-deoxyphosphooctonate aldolase [Roseivirga pacifica]